MAVAKITRLQALNNAIVLLEKDGQNEASAVLTKMADSIVRGAESKKNKTTKKSAEKAKENSELDEKVFGVIMDGSATNATAIGKALNVSTQKASSCVKRLVDGGRVERVKIDKKLGYKAIA